MKSNSRYPVLRTRVRLKAMPSCCWVVDDTSNDGERIHPLEGFVLSLCTGENADGDIAYILQRTLAKSFEWGEQLVDQTLERRGRYLHIAADATAPSTRYDPVAFLYQPQQTARSDEERLDSPAQLELILTHRCNFKCIYCFNASSPAKLHEMSTQDWLRILAEAKEQGVVKCTVSGGEPMTHPGFRQIVNRIVDYGMLAYVCTNGSLIDEDAVRFFVDIGLPSIQISLDSVDEGVHDRMSQARGSLPAVRAAIRALVRAGIDVLVKSVITPVNFPGVGQLIDACHDWGVKRLVLDRFDLSNAGRGNERLFLSPGMEREMARIVEERCDRYRGDDFSIAAVTMPRCWQDEGDIIVCGALSTGMVIFPNGSVSLCEKLVDYPSMVVGNVHRQSLEEVWSSPDTWGVLRPPPGRVDPTCRDCDHLASCHTGCFAQTLLVTDNPYAPDPRCWRAAYQNSPYVQYAREETRRATLG